MVEDCYTYCLLWCHIPQKELRCWKVLQIPSNFCCQKHTERGNFGCQGEVLHRESGEVLEQAAQRGCGCSIPGHVQGQVGWGPGQPGLLPDVEVGSPATNKGGVGTSRSSGSLPTQTIPWFYDFMWLHCSSLTSPPIYASRKQHLLRLPAWSGKCSNALSSLQLPQK